MSEQEELMDNIMNVDLEIIETVRTLQQENWNTEELKNQVTDLLKIHDEIVGKLRSLQGDDSFLWLRTRPLLMYIFKMLHNSAMLIILSV